MKKLWTEIACEIPAAMVDLMSDFLVELSGNGVSIENLSLDTFSLDSIEEAPIKTIKAYFSDFFSAELLAAIETFLRTRGPAFAGFVYKPPAVTAVKEEDWANNWKEHFKPVRIGTRLVIKPTWEEYAVADGDIILELDPGMAFGTGAHATTKMCLELLEKIFFHEGPFKTDSHSTVPATVLDVGTGSGVLSIAAAKMGAERIAAIDIDADAVIVAEENLALNDVQALVAASTTPLREVTGTYAIVLANILAEELVRLAPELVAKVEPWGYLILSGVLREREDFVVDGFSGYGLSLIESCHEAEWSCLGFRLERP
jgi:ribosomal protein L11 methyltransferase